MRRKGGDRAEISRTRRLSERLEAFSGGAARRCSGRLGRSTWAVLAWARSVPLMVPPSLISREYLFPVRSSITVSVPGPPPGAGRSALVGTIRRTLRARPRRFSCGAGGSGSPFAQLLATNGRVITERTPCAAHAPGISAAGRAPRKVPVVVGRARSEPASPVRIISVLLAPARGPGSVEEVVTDAAEPHGSVAGHVGSPLLPAPSRGGVGRCWYWEGVAAWGEGLGS